MSRPYAQLALVILFSLLLASCNSGGGNSTAVTPLASDGAAAAVPTPTVLATTTTASDGSFFFPKEGARTRTIAGSVVFDGPVAGARVDLVTVNGEYQVQVRLPDGSTALADASLPSADTAAASGTQAVGGGRGWIWVTPVSHLIASYRASIGGDQTRALRDVKQYLGLNDRAFVNRPYVSTVATQFSPATFLAEANRLGGLRALTELVIAEITAGRQRFFSRPDDAAALRLLPIRPAILERPVQGQRRQAGRGIQRLGLGPAAPTSLFGTVLSNIFSSVLTDGLSSLAGWLGGKVGLSSATARQLDAIQGQLTQVQTQLNSIQLQLEKQTTVALTADLFTSTITPVSTFNSQEILSLGNTAGYLPLSPLSSTTFISGMVALLNTTLAQNYASNIVGLCIDKSGGGNVVIGRTQAYAEAYGSGGAPGTSAKPASASATPPPLSNSFNTWTYFYDFRNDSEVTPAIANMTDYYAGELAGATNMLEESYRQPLGQKTVDGQSASGPPASSLTTGQRLVNGTTQTVGGGMLGNGISALTKRLLQQQPLSLLDNQCPLPNGIWVAPGASFRGIGQSGQCFNGTIWTHGFEVNQSSSDTGVYVTEYLTDYNVNGWWAWYLPTTAQCKQLAAYAQQAALNDGVYGDTAIPYGLHKMGLLTTNYSTSLTNVQIYCNLEAGSNLTCQLYSTSSGKVGGTGLDKKGDFQAQGSGNVCLVLPLRPFPGVPQGVTTNTLETNPVYGATGGVNNCTNFGQGTLGSPAGPDAPSYIQSSATYQAALASSRAQVGVSQENSWNTTMLLAGNIPPNEIVVTRDTASDPRQLHAYAIWWVPTDTWDLPYVPGGFGAIFTQYIAYTEVTDFVEWLSSNTKAIEVSNFPMTTLEVKSASGGPVMTVTGASLTPAPNPSPVPSPPCGFAQPISGGDVTILNPVMSGGSPCGTISGGTVYAAGTLSGTVTNGVTADGQPFSGSVPAATIVDGRITSGTVCGGTLYTLTGTDGTKTASLLAGATITDATITGGTLYAGEDVLGPSFTQGQTVFTPSRAGRLTVHDGSTPVTITASFMTNANTTDTTNALNSTWTFVPVPSPSPTPAWPSVSIPAGTFTETPTLTHLTITPNNFQIQLTGAGTFNQNFFVTGFYSDGTCADLTALATWNAYIPSQNGTTVTIGPSNQATFSGNVLQFPSTYSQCGEVVVTAEYGGRTTIALISVLPSK